MDNMKILELQPGKKVLVFKAPTWYVRSQVSMGYLLMKLQNEASFIAEDEMFPPARLEKAMRRSEKVPEYKDVAHKLPDGDWKQIGLLKDMTEELWKEIMPLIDKNDPSAGYERFLSDEEFKQSDRVESCATAMEAGLSFFHANEVYSKNPLAGIFTPRPAERTGTDLGSVLGDAIYNDLRAEFLKAEANTGTWVIFLEINNSQDNV